MTTREVINKTLDTMESERLEAVKELICAADVCTHDQIIELAGIANHSLMIRASLSLE